MDPGRIMSALPDAVLGVVFLVTWFSPNAFGDRVLLYAMLTMLLEFIVVHSSAFMGIVLWGSLDRAKKVLAVIGLGLFYSTFLVAFALSLGAWWPLWGFWGLTANRMTNALFQKGSLSEGHRRMVSDWATSVAWYLLWTFATTLLWVPRLGITPEVAQQAGIAGEGLWVDEPHRVVVAAAGYFLCQAVSELRAEPLLAIRPRGASSK